jgi:hypothetical protein
VGLLLSRKTQQQPALARTHPVLQCLARLAGETAGESMPQWRGGGSARRERSTSKTLRHSAELPNMLPRPSGILYHTSTSSRPMNFRAEVREPSHLPRAKPGQSAARKLRHYHPVAHRRDCFLFRYQRPNSYLQALLRRSRVERLARDEASPRRPIGRPEPRQPTREAKDLTGHNGLLRGVCRSSEISKLPTITLGEVPAASV